MRFLKLAFGKCAWKWNLNCMNVCEKWTTGPWEKKTNYLFCSFFIFSTKGTHSSPASERLKSWVRDLCCRHTGATAHHRRRKDGDADFSEEKPSLLLWQPTPTAHLSRLACSSRPLWMAEGWMEVKLAKSSPRATNCITVIYLKGSALWYGNMVREHGAGSWWGMPKYRVFI